MALALNNKLVKEGLTGLNSPKTVLREAFSANLIDNEDLWLEMLNDKNSTVHIYSENSHRNM